MEKEAQYQIKGISQDLAFQLFNPQYAFEAKNIRINTTDENSLLSLSNERGNSLVHEFEIYEEEERKLRVLGTGLFSDYCILFCKDIGDVYSINMDFICKIDNKENVTILYQGDLGFDINYPIRTVCAYENENIQKVYWIDGKNPPRVINVVGSKDINQQKINFLPKLNFQEQVSIERTSGGKFPSGVIQYALTYSDKNMQESNIFYVSPLYYSTLPSRGADAETSCNLAFKLNFTNLDTSYDYIQIYVIVRTSLNETPSVYRISNISTTVDSFTDSGYQWETYDAATLQAKQLNTFVPKVITSKDNTLFLGNYTLTSPDIDLTSTEEMNYIKSIKNSIEVGYKAAEFYESSEFSLANGSQSVKTFRDNEWYRLGVQFEDEYGTPSNIVYLKDITTRMGNTPYDNTFKQKVITAAFPKAPDSIKNKFKRARLVMVDRENLPHSTICQGLLCPTVYRVLDRYNNIPFAMASWNMRASTYYNDTRSPQWLPDYPLHPNTCVGGGEIENQTKSMCNTSDGGSRWTELFWGTGNTDTTTTYRYLCTATIYNSATYGSLASMNLEPRQRLLSLWIRLGRTSNVSVTKVTDCETIYTKKREIPLYTIDQAYAAKGIDIYTSSGILQVVQDYLLSYLSGVSNKNQIVGQFMSAAKENTTWTTLPGRNVYYSYLIGDWYHSSSGNAVATDTIGSSPSGTRLLAESIGQTFYCDHNILTFHSPDIEKYQTLIDNNNSIKYRVVGYTCMTNSYFSDYLITENGPKTSSDTTNGVQSASVNPKYLQGACNIPLWKDDGKIFPTYLWHRANSLGDQMNADSNTGLWYGGYTKKIFSNIHYCRDSYAFYNETFWQKDWEGRGPSSSLAAQAYMLSDTALLSKQDYYDLALKTLNLGTSIQSRSTLIKSNANGDLFLAIVYKDSQIITELKYGQTNIVTSDVVNNNAVQGVTAVIETVDIDSQKYHVCYVTDYHDQQQPTFSLLLQDKNAETVAPATCYYLPSYDSGTTLQNDINTAEGFATTMANSQSFTVAANATANGEFSVQQEEGKSIRAFVVPSTVTVNSIGIKTSTSSSASPLWVGGRRVDQLNKGWIESYTYNGVTYKVWIIAFTGTVPDDATIVCNVEYSIAIDSSNTTDEELSKYYNGNDYGVFTTMGTPRVFNSNEITALSLQPQKNGDCIHSSLIYYGNVNFTHNHGSYATPVYSSSTSTSADTGETALTETISEGGNSISDTVHISYKSTPHVVMPMSYKIRREGVAPPNLPHVTSTMCYMCDNSAKYGYLWSTKACPIWRTAMFGTSETLDNYIFIAELYQDLTVEDIYGDTSEDNLCKYTWIPISKWVTLGGAESVEGYGDTFIGRWDCLKSYAYSDDNAQSYIDITSVVLESDKNLESRYDSYKNIHNATMVTSTNFGLYNDVYNQQDNFFSYRLLKQSNLVDNFQNQVCWSEVKTLGEELDTWCQINVGNNEDFQGEYGQLQALINFQNELYGIQDNAVYKLNYNTRVAISPSDGQPIQISNNYKVDPPLMIKSQCGITNQDAVVTSPNYMYFYDERRHRIYRLQEGSVIDLSTQKGVNALLDKQGNYVKALFDVNCKDIYFNFANSSIAFNEDLDEFTSLYDYNQAGYLFPLGDKSYVTYKNQIWKQRSGNWTSFFGQPKEFYIQVLVNDNPLLDKTFGTVDFYMNSDNGEAFDTLEAWDSYQSGKSSLVNTVKTTKFQEKIPVERDITNGSLRKKFKLWRAQLPRVTGSRDRLRDMWLMVKLSKTTKTNSPYRVNNINVSYF